MSKSLVPSMRLRNFLFIVFSLFFLVLLFYASRISFDEAVFAVQLLSMLSFCCFFMFGHRFTPRAFFVFALIYQLTLSVMLGEIFLQHQYLIDNNADWKTYVRWASIAQRTNGFLGFYKQLRTEAFEFADCGYPIFLYPYYALFSRFEDAYFAAIIGKTLFYMLGSWYVYKIAIRFLAKSDAKNVFLLWSLNPAGVFFNGINLKENVFVTVCVFAVYAALVFRDTRKVLYFLAFLFFTALTLFFRMFVTFFIFATFLASTVFRTFIKKHFYLIWIIVGILGVLVIKILMNYTPLGFFVGQSIGGKSGIAMPVLILMAFVSPVPAFNADRTTPDNLLVCAYSVFTVILSWYAIYELFLIFRQKKERLYPLVFLTFFNKLLVIIAARPQEYRFQYPLAFVYVILMICGFSDASRQGMSIIGKKHFGFSLCAVCTICMAVMLTYLYNGAPGR